MLHLLPLLLWLDSVSLPVEDTLHLNATLFHLLISFLLFLLRIYIVLRYGVEGVVMLGMGTEREETDMGTEKKSHFNG